MPLHGRQAQICYTYEEFSSPESTSPGSFLSLFVPVEMTHDQDAV